MLDCQLEAPVMPNWEQVVLHSVANDCVQRVVGFVPNIQQFVECPHLCHHHQRVQLHADHRSGPPDQFGQSGSVLFLYSAHHGVKEDAANHRLVKHLQEFAADVEGPQSPQEVHPALCLVYQNTSVM